MAQNVKFTLSAVDKTAPGIKTAVANLNGLKTAALGISSSLAGLGAGIGLAGLASLAKAAIDSVDSLNDLKDATGASIENISALEDIAARTGTSFDTVGSALIKFNAALKDVDRTKELGAAFKAINLDVAELRRLDPADALLKTSIALSQFADDGNKARLMQEIFGKSLKDIAPLLKDLADKGKLVATVTTEQAQAAEDFNKNLFELQKNASDLSRSLVSDMVPAINEVVKAFKDGQLAGESFLETGLKRYKANIRAFYGLAPEQVNTGGATGDFGLGAGGGRGSVNPALVKPSVNIPNPSPTAKPARTGAAKDPYAEAARYIENLQKQIEKTQELSAVQQLGYDLNAGRLGKVSTQQQNAAVALALRIDGIKAETDAQKELNAEQEQFFTDVAAADAQYQSLLERLTANTSSARAKAQQDDLAVLQRALASNQISQQTYTEAVIDRFDLANEKIKETKSLADELGLSFASAFEDAIVKGGSLSEVLQGIEQDILRIVTRKLVTEPLGNAVTGILGGFNFGSLFSADGGGYTGGANRTGGVDGKGGFMAVLHPQETVIDHTRGQRIGGGVNVTINQSFAQGTSRATVLQAAAEASRQLSYAGRNL